MKLSFSTLLTVAAFGYFIFTAWSLCGIFFPTDCKGNHGCLKPAWNPKDKFRMEVSFHDSSKLVKTDFFILEDGALVGKNLTPPASVFRNQTYNVRVTLFGNSGALWSEQTAVTTYKEPVRTAFHLLNEQNSSTSTSAKSDGLPVNFWLTTLRVYVLTTPVVLTQFDVPPELAPHLRVFSTSGSSSSGPASSYNPVVYVNPEMQKTTDWIQVPDLAPGVRNSSDFPKLPFALSIEPQSIGKFRLRCTLGMLAHQLRSYGFRPKDIDEVRQLLVDTNFYFLLTTMFVSVFHLLFDFLAFKNDISFWRKTSNTTGLSSRTVVWRFVSSFIISLHLLEERSSLLVLIPMCISTCIELWKLARICKFSFTYQHGFRLGSRTKGEEETDRLDAEFMFWLQCLMIPLCVAGGIYSLLYTPHRSWYSWCLQTLVHGVYAFGFLFMTPQLFINYRLKSVAHLPWKALTYKAFNTFIDDFFAMIIVMPTSHRIACLRDDVVFLIYLYQRWLYPVDKSRVNEFGMRGDENNDQPSTKIPKHDGKRPVDSPNSASDKKTD